MGHVPTKPSMDTSILSFEEAVAGGGVNVEATGKSWLYVPDHYADYRYVLGTKGSRPVVCIGLNPSTARPGDLDPTLKSVERIAHFNGYDSFIMLNIYAQRATDPKDMDAVPYEYLHQQNLAALDWVLSQLEEPAVWAAWGAKIARVKDDRLMKCTREMVEVAEKHNATWLKAGALLKAGHPRHPLYQRSDSVLEEFDVREYLDKLPLLG